MEPDEIDDRIIIVVEETPGSPHWVQPGVYEVRRTPFYSQPLIGQGGLWSDELRLVATLTAFNDDDAPCGYLCPRCRLDAMHGMTWA